MSDGDHPDPFHALRFTYDEDIRSPGARRAAFREDPSGILVSGDSSECQIARDEREVVKSGSRVLVEESRALQFARSLHLPVPALREVRAFDQKTAITMDFVDGECLEEGWQSMNLKQKQSVAEQIRDIITTMRQATPTQDSIGAFGGPARDCRQYSDYSGGPFKTEAEFNNFVLDLLRGTPSLVRRALADALDVNSRIVFTHSDLTPRNIIVKGDRVQALLDWEYSGWYPEYWEYVKFFDRPTTCKDWKQYAETMFDIRYPKELLTYQALARWQRP